MKQAIIIFRVNYQQGFWYKQAVKGIQEFVFCVVKVNLMVVFEHFEGLKNLIVLNTVKEKLVISCLVGYFYLKKCHDE